ncbi:hypothetical protein EMIHUDRAFT_259478, partial [Emiliania huxleyi CCMP1516]|uniref:C2H2-type domain-containing protein n=2 Tax=Emiliania huxleyi TaxID=2903 RepID=A0A0D3I0I7_EMIH1
MKYPFLRPFKCEECGLAFVESNKLTMHRRRAHGSEAAEQPNAASVVNDVSGQKRGKLEGSTESPAKLLKERDVAMATA